MCRSIKLLRRPEPPLEPTEVSAAALQFVRKVSGFRAPSRANEAAFNAAVTEIAAATDKLLAQLSPHRDAPATTANR
ncbi:MAG: hypothetical protein JWN34_3229 [Bryobacterales bacterium]|jgi:hypothetical protein|nr:hypothetical protein [Bryobacterales bacterium]